MDYVSFDSFLNEFDIDKNLIELLFKGNEKFFIDCLKMFLEDTGIPGLKESIELSDYKSSFEHAHALKGVSATLGLRRISSAFDKFVIIYRAGEYENLFDEWTKIEKIIEQLKIGTLKYIGEKGI